ncbi:MAG: fibronectin type III domain-containing protein [Firmicutes bacterium]|nr:fibronectin type III domain-containing protein [Bacillota bacterium]
MKRKLITLAAAFAMVCTMAVVGTANPVYAVTADAVAWECGHTEAIRANSITKNESAKCDVGTTYEAFCDTCVSYVRGQADDAPGHQFTSNGALKHKASDATCIAPATYYYTCENCTAVGTETFEYGPLSKEHSYVRVNCVKGKCSLCEATATVKNGKHDFAEATCTTPKKCKKCGETEGTVVHKWKDATCAAPKTCTLCGATEGGLKPHAYKAATCTTPKTCKNCQATEGSALGHKWFGQTCVTSAVCGVCGEIGEGPLPHNVIIDPGTPATCADYGLSAYEKCADCGKFLTEQTILSRLPHAEGYVSTVPAMLTLDGTITKICSVCHLPYDETKIPKIGAITVKEKVAYTGKYVKPKVTVKDSKGKVLKQGRDYTLKYGKNKAIGNAYVDVKFKGNYFGTATAKFQVVPKTPTIKKPVSAKKTLTAKWVKGKKAQVSGYEVMYSTNKNFFGGKTVKVNGYKKTSVKIKKLQSKKTYYVKVRAYKSVKVVGRWVKIYSNWSTVKKVKVK